MLYTMDKSMFRCDHKKVKQTSVKMFFQFRKFKGKG